MPAAETARLIAELTLRDKFSKGIDAANKKVGALDTSIGKISDRARQGASAAGRNIAAIGAIAVGGITLAVRSGLQDLATLESAVTSVDGAIAQVGLTGQVTGAQIAAWANDIESSIDAAFDDKEITAATEGLIRYGKVTTSNLRPAMQVMTDLAARVGSVETAGELLAKALADPTKAAGKLSRYGIILTKQQQAQIKAMVEAGDVAGAQALLLDELAKSTTGAAAAMAGPYEDAINKTNDAWEDARKALAIGFLPVITKVADLLSRELAKQSTIDALKDFGKTLAGALDSLVEIGRNLPWKQIGDSLRLGGQGARTILGAFSSLPPWIQTAVLTGWGLNKLTGGALGGIVGELSKGLVKGVLGMTAGVVNLKAGTVVGGGMVPGTGTGTPIAGGKGGAVLTGRTFITGIAAGVLAGLAVELAAQLGDQSTRIQEQGKTLIESTKANAPKMSERELVNAIDSIGNQLRNPLNAAALLITEPLNNGLSNLERTEKELRSQLVALRASTAVNAAATNTTQDKSKAAIIEEQRRTKTATVAGLDEMRTVAAQQRQEAAAGFGRTSTGLAQTRSAVTAGAASVSAAVRASRPVVNTSVRVFVTAARVTSTQTTQSRYGPGTGTAQANVREFG